MNKNQKEIVKEAYSSIAKSNNEGCCCIGNSGKAVEASLKLGYSDDELKNIPKESNLGLGCGNPLSIANIKTGETVLDLGSGAGLDCFLAASKVGPSGKVFGVDMTTEMINKAKENAAKSDINNVEFLLGDIENLPLESNSVDVVISNCVINLCEDKQQVYNDIYRVLKQGGRIAISDVAMLKPFSVEILNHSDLLCSCISGAVSIEKMQTIVSKAGFNDVKIAPKYESKEFIKDWSKEDSIEDYVISVNVTAIKS